MELQIGKFTKKPDCQNAALKYEVQHYNRTAVSRDFGVSVDDEQELLIINTKNGSFAGHHMLTLKVSLESFSAVYASFDFNLTLIYFDPSEFLFQLESEDGDSYGDSDGNKDGSNDVAFDLNKSDYVMAINKTGAFDFELPEATG